MIKKIVVLTGIGFILGSCSSMTMMVESEPQQATVYLKDGKKLKKLGETPLELSARDFPNSEHFNFSIQKEGYQPQDVLIDKRSMSAEAEVFATLQKLPQMNEQTGLLSQDTTASQQRSLSSIQSQLLSNNHSQAEVLARGFLNKFPYSAVGWNLLGNAYLLQNRNQQALESYRRALEYDPDNQDTQKIIQFLQVTPTRRSR